MGKPATRLTDMTAHGGTIMGPGVPTVMTGKMPAATILDQHVCPMVTGVVPHVGGPATLGSTGVFFGKKPAGRVGDLHVCVGPPSMPVMGCFTVMIGEVGGGGGGGGAGAAAAAASANTSSPASVEPFALAEPPPATEIHYSHFKFTDSAGKGLGGIPFLYTGPDKAEIKGCSAPGGEAYYSGLPKKGSYKVKAGALSDAKWSKTKAALEDELELTVKADGFEDGVSAILSIVERSNTGIQRFLHSERCKVQGKKIKAKWKVDLGPDDTEAPPADKSARTEFTYQFIAYAEGGVAVSDKLGIDSDLEIEVLDEIAQPVADKPVEVLLTNGEVKTGKLDANGKFKVGKVPAKPALVRLKVPSVFRGSLSGYYFDTAKCFLLPSALQAMEKLKTTYFNHPDLQILIVGHSDRAGDAQANLTLSKDRAEAVAAFLKDDFKAWTAYYGKSKPAINRWGIVEDKTMLWTLKDGGTPFFTGAITGKKDKAYTAAVKHFQTWCNGQGKKLPTDGVADATTREELITRYMGLDGTNLPSSVVIKTHGCGESHNHTTTADGVPNSSNRRVEIFMFEDAIEPAPQANCPQPAGCPEWAQWGKRVTNLIEITPATTGIARSEFSQAVLDRFQDMDTNKDGFLDKEEIRTALGRKDFKGQHGAMVSVLKRLYGKFEDFHDDEIGPEIDGITLADIDAYDRKRVASPKDKLITDIDYWYQATLDRISQANRSAFVGALDPLVVRQGAVGDCWFLSAMVGLAASRPAEIVAMIKPLGNQKFEVKFPGHPSPITVETPTDGELGTFAFSGTNGIWATILEKAYGTKVNKDAYLIRDTSVTDAADGGARLSKGIGLLTGHDDDSDELFLTRISTTRTKLIAAFKAGKVVGAGINGGIIADTANNGLPLGHAYTVMGYNATTDVISVRNPWGHTGPTGLPVTRGVFDMPLPDFVESFSDLTIEE